MAYENIKKVPVNNSTDLVWINWFDSLKKTFGKKKARSLFSANWDAQDGDGSNANTSDLRGHLKDNGIDISGGVLGEAKDKFFDAGDFVGDYLTIGKWIGIGLVSVVAVSIGAVVFQLATKSSVRKEALGIGKTIATRGAM